MIFPAFFTSSITAFKRSSNSPLYFAPAIKALISRAITRLFARLVGTSRFTIICARPSTIAVFPTPGSPSNIGLFFVLRIKICIMRVISSSLPITGSSSPARAFAFRSTPNFLSASRFSSLLSFVIFAPPLIASSSLFSSLISMYLAKICFTLLSAKLFAISQVSSAMKLSPISSIFALASSKLFSSSEPIFMFSLLTFELVGKEPTLDFRSSISALWFISLLLNT